MADRTPETSTVRESLAVVRAVVEIVDERPEPWQVVQRVGEIMEAAKQLRPHMVDDVLDHLHDRYPGMAEERRARADALARRVRGDDPPLAEDQQPDPELSPPDVAPDGHEPEPDEPGFDSPPVETASADGGVEPLWDQDSE